MIRSISSSIESFKALSFRPGLNIILADTTRSSTEKQTRNSAGKTSIIEILHFLLGADADKTSLFKKPEIINETFSGTFVIKGVDLVVTRSGSNDKKIFLAQDGLPALLGVSLHRDDESGGQYLTLDEWRNILGHLWFALPLDRERTEFDGPFAPTFRSLIGYFIRRRKAGGLGSIEKQNSFQQPWDWQVNLSYLLGLDWHIPREIQDLRARKKTLTSLRRAIKDGELGEMFGTSAEIRPELARTEERIERLRVRIANFEVLESYRELADEVARLKHKISDKTLELASVQETIAYLSRSVEEEQPPPYAAVEKLYEAAGIELPQVALRRFDEVKQFQRSVTENRRRYLEQQIEDARRSQFELQTNLAGLDQRKSQLLKILDGKGAFEDLIRLHEELATFTSRAETLRMKLQNANILENNVAQQKLEAADLQLRLQEDYKKNEPAIKNATVKVDQIIGELYDDRTGNLIITAGRNGPEISISIQGGGNLGGIDMMKIFCFDMMLCEIVAERLGGPGFVVHDSHLFDGVDARQVRAALAVGAATAQRVHGQYIVTLNSDEFGKIDLADAPEIKRSVLPVHLTDDEAGGLFGFRFD